MQSFTRPPLSGSGPAMSPLPSDGLLTLRAVMLVSFDLEQGPVILGQAPRPDSITGPARAVQGSIREAFERLSGLFVAQENGQLGATTSYIVEEHSDLVFLYHAVDLTSDDYRRYHFRFTPAFAFTITPNRSNTSPGNQQVHTSIASATRWLRPTIDVLEAELSRWTLPLESLRDDLVDKERRSRAVSTVANAPSNPSLQQVQSALARMQASAAAGTDTNALGAAASTSGVGGSLPQQGALLGTSAATADPFGAPRGRQSPGLGDSVSAMSGRAAVALPGPALMSSSPLESLSSAAAAAGGGGADPGAAAARIDSALSTPGTSASPAMSYATATMSTTTGPASLSERTRWLTDSAEPPTANPAEEHLVSFDIGSSNAFDAVDPIAHNLLGDVMLGTATPFSFAAAVSVPEVPSLQDVLNGTYDALKTGQRRFAYPSGDVLCLALAPSTVRGTDSRLLAPTEGSLIVFGADHRGDDDAEFDEADSGWPAEHPTLFHSASFTELDVPVVLRWPTTHGVTSSRVDLVVADVWRAIDNLRNIGCIAKQLGLPVSAVREALHVLREAGCVFVTPGLPYDQPEDDSESQRGSPTAAGTALTAFPPSGKSAAAAMLSAFQQATAALRSARTSPPLSFRLTDHFHHHVLGNLRHEAHSDLGEFAHILLSLDAEEERSMADAATPNFVGARSFDAADASNVEGSFGSTRVGVISADRSAEDGGIRCDAGAVRPSPIDVAAAFVWDVLPLFDQVPCGHPSTVLQIVDDAVAMVAASTGFPLDRAELEADMPADVVSARRHLASEAPSAAEELAAMHTFPVLNAVSYFWIALMRFAAAYGWLGVVPSAGSCDANA